MTHPSLAILRFEIGYHLRRPAFWLIALVYGGFGFADMYSNASAGNAFFYVNSPSQIFHTTVWYTLFSVLAATALVGETFVRDARVGMEQLVLATPVRKLDYLGVRFLGALACTVLAFSLYLPGMLIGAAMPGLNPHAVGPLRIDAYALSYVLVALPNLFVLSVLAFMLTALTRSIVTAYVGAIVLLMIYISAMLLVGVESVDDAQLAFWSLFDLYGHFAVQSLMLSWTVHQHNTAMPAVDGVLLANRLLWCGLAIAAWWWAYRRFDMRPAARVRRTRSVNPPAPATAAGVAIDARPPSAVPGWRQLPLLIWHEVRPIAASRGFRLLVFCGFVSLFFAAAGSRSFEHSNPSTDILLFTSRLYFDYVLLAIVLLYAAELAWRGRDAGIQGVIDATPLPTWLMVLAKLGGLFAIVTMNLLLCMLALALFQIVHGYHRLELALSAQTLFLVHGPYFYFMAVLALFLQALTRQRYLGLALGVVVAVSPVPLDAFGLYHNLYRFGATNDLGYSPMNGWGGLLEGHLWYVAYWSAFCAALAIVTCVIWPRGALDPGRRGSRRPWRRNWRAAPISLHRSLGLASALTATLAAWIVYNTVVLNPFQPPGKELLAVNHERLFKRYENLPMPVVVGTRLKVDMYPDERRFVAIGAYRLENRSGRPIAEIHLSTFLNLELVRVKVPGARLSEAHPQWGYFIYRLDAPMLPGAQLEMEFVTRSETIRGFRNQVDSDDVYMVAPNEALHNGTSLYSPFILPFIGYTKMVEHKEAWLRDKHGLPPLDSRMRAHDDPVGLAQALTVSHLAWGDSEVVIGTAGAQTPVSSGREVRRWQEDGRQYVHYRSEAPHRGKFTLYSARYDTLAEHGARVPVTLYYHPPHAENARPMAHHMAGALDFYERAFGPYPYGQVRLVEFAYYPGMVFSEGGTIGLPEVLGWKADLAGDGEDAMIGWISYLLAHAWWEDQLIAADVVGSMTVREALSGYAANLYRRAIYPAERVSQLKRRQMQDYFRALGKVDFEEPSLDDVYNEVLVARYKGQMVLELIESRIGQPALLSAIREFLQIYRHRESPYATVLDLRDTILRHAPPGMHKWIGEQFSEVITYRYGLSEATYTQAPGGGYRVSLRVEASKRTTCGLGEYRDASLDVPLALALLDDRSQVLRRVEIDLQNFDSEVVIDIPVRPSRVILDPELTLPTATFAGREERLRYLYQ